MVTKDLAGGRGRHRLNSQTTRAAIVEAAGRLFGEVGYDEVTMRRIAAAAGCSHTAIYRYFADKEALLEALTRPVLEQMSQDFDRLSEAASSAASTAETERQTERLVEMSMAFVRFGIRHRTMFRVFFTVKAERVDQEPKPDSGAAGINRLRVHLFEQLSWQLARALGLDAADERLLPFSRGLYYLLHGMIGTYETSEESDEQLLERLQPTFHGSIRCLIRGYCAEIHT